MKATQEQERIRALRYYQILDTPPDGAFDRITALAAHLLRTPISIASLVDTDRIWFKSHHGTDVQQVDRVPGLCASAILQDEAYVLTDARIDPRSLANPLVAGEMGLRFYAAVPLQTQSGHNLGTLCVIDFQPRTIDETELDILRTLAQVIMDQMELRLAARRIGELNEELVDALAALEIQATHDALTGLFNRGAIMMQLDKLLALARREGKPLTIMLADIDFFKKINDSHGHLAGDRVLIELARQLQQAVRNSDSVGRIGGEEFLLIMYPSDMASALQAAERIRETVAAAPIIVDDQGTTVTATLSAGLFCTEDHPGMDAHQLLLSADKALYESKDAGRNRVTVGRVGINGLKHAEQPKAGDTPAP